MTEPKTTRKESADAILRNAREAHQADEQILTEMRSRHAQLITDRERGTSGDTGVDLPSVFTELKDLEERIEQQVSIVAQAGAVVAQAEMKSHAVEHEKLKKLIRRQDRASEKTAEKIEETVHELIAAVDAFEEARTERHWTGKAADRSAEMAGIQAVGLAGDVPVLPCGRGWDATVRPFVKEISNRLARGDA